jgi:hypothetical protein
LGDTVTFELIRLRFHFCAAGSLYFPPGKAGNTLRGAFGMMLRETADASEYARIFEPKAVTGPSGLADPPRPFVIRAAQLDGQTIPPGRGIPLRRAPVRLSRRPAAAVRRGLRAPCRRRPGAGTRPRGTALVDQENIAIDFDGPIQQAAQIRVQFVTPTELKGAVRPEFPILFARLRDRISTLRALYGPGPSRYRFPRHGRARRPQVRLSRCDLTWHATERRSSRTGQTHPLGGFTGEAEYDGDLGEFLPYLRAGQWTGVGRQTVWGKGEICFQLCS